MSDFCIIRVKKHKSAASVWEWRATTTEKLTAQPQPATPPPIRLLGIQPATLPLKEFANDCSRLRRFPGIRYERTKQWP